MPVSLAEAYAALDVAPTCSDEELAKAYRKLALKYHPDKNGNDPAATERMKAIGEAKSVVDEHRRAGGSVDEAPSALVVLASPLVLFYLLWTLLWATLWTDAVEFPLCAWSKLLGYALALFLSLWYFLRTAAFFNATMLACIGLGGAFLIDMLVICYEHAFKTTMVALMMTNSLGVTSSTPVIFWLGTHWLGYAHWIRPYTWHPYMLSVIAFHTTRSALHNAQRLVDEPVDSLAKHLGNLVQMAVGAGLVISAIPLMAHEFAAGAYSLASPYFYVWLLFSAAIFLGVVPTPAATE